MNPILNWPGGKRRLAKHILPIFSKIPHACYVEPFCGTLGMFLAKTERAKSEVLNDNNVRLVTLFRVAQRHPNEFCRLLNFELHSNHRFQNLRVADKSNQTDIERAVDFYLEIMLSFGATGGNAGFAFSRTRRARHHMDRLADGVELAERLSGVHIECLDWEDCVARYDSPATLFFCDPPYTEGGVKAYANFSEEDVQRLAERLSAIKGKAVVTLNHSRANLKAFRGFRAIQISRQKGINNRQGSGQNPYHEVIFVSR